MRVQAARIGALVLAAVLLLAACTSSSAARHAVTHALVSTPASSASTGLGPPPTLTQCARATAVPAITDCLRRSVAAFWSTEVRQPIDEPVHVEVPTAQVPELCRRGVVAAPAFTCRANLELYVNTQLVQVIATRVPAAQRAYAYAVVQAHEVGHVVQFRLHQPQSENDVPTAAQTRFVEQQADCLSGVWARHEAAGGGLDVAAFRRVAAQLLAILNVKAEQATHGTTPQRLAAIDRGLRHGDPKDCQLVTFS
ncbi:neutral zinc metallopeptidase [uncultured Jatrophihabitans sp.]|uniref:neutral zinc metallopeptidase n=1 Tax=uncultured Jatrophihabitans sp. TaxID=1610747 RepID=UPI0035CA575A